MIIDKIKFRKLSISLIYFLTITNCMISYGQFNRDRDACTLYPPQSRDWFFKPELDTSLTPDTTDLPGYNRYYFPSTSCRDLWQNTVIFNNNHKFHSDGYQMLLYSKDNSPQGAPSIDSPIVVIQGIDPYFGSGKQHGFHTLEEIMNTLIDEFTLAKIDHTIERGLLDSLYHAGYDIFFILFKNPNLTVETNANVLIKALEEVQNSTHMTYGNEIVLIGPSLGGLVSRYALQLLGSDLDIDGNTKVKVKTFISFDAPNRGAEIPMSLQALVRYLAPENITAFLLNKNLTSPAADQMLLKQVEGDETGRYEHEIEDYELISTPFGQIMDTINDANFVMQLENFTPFLDDPACFPSCVVVNDYLNTAAITNGSGSGQYFPYLPGMSYAVMVEKTYVIFKELYLELKISSSAPGSQVFYGETGKRPPLRYVVKEPVLLEAVPGSIRNSYEEIRLALIDADYKWLGFDPNVKNHSFIPTLSAAGLIKDDLIYDLNNPAFWGLSCNLLAQNSIFKNVHCASTLNQPHLAITTLNKQIFLNLLQ